MSKKEAIILDWINGTEHTPLTAEIHLTNKCNLKCLSCWQRTGRVNINKELSDDAWLTLMDELVNLGVQSIYIGGGGEPFCRKDLLLRIMKITKDKSLHGSITTNATLLDSQTVKKIVKMNWDEIQLSIDGADRKTQDNLRGQDGVFRKNIEAIELFKQLKSQLKKKKPVLSFHIVISNKNYNQLSAIISLAAQYDVKVVNLQHLVKQNKLYAEMVLSQKAEAEFQEYLLIAQATADKKGITTNFRDFMKKDENKRAREEQFNIHCTEPFTHITIHENGDVKSCCNPRKPAGNVRKKSLEAIWFGTALNKQRKEMLKKLPKECCTHPNKRMGIIRFINRKNKQDD